MSSRRLIVSCVASHASADQEQLTRGCWPSEGAGACQTWALARPHTNRQRASADADSANLHPLLQQYLRALVAVLLGSHTIDTLRQYTASHTALRGATYPPSAPPPFGRPQGTEAGGSDTHALGAQLLHDARMWPWAQLSAEALVKRSLLSIAPCNASEFTAASQVVVHVDVKNLPSLAVKVLCSLCVSVRGDCAAVQRPGTCISSTTITP